MTQLKLLHDPAPVKKHCFTVFAGSHQTKHLFLGAHLTKRLMVFPRCCTELVVAESVVVIKKLLQMQPEKHSDIIKHMAKLTDNIQVSHRQKTAASGVLV